jgi:hypothetical protein
VRTRLPVVFRKSGARQFSPSDITGLAAWYDASNAASITLNGSTVSQWNDLSGNGRHQVQGSASLQPTYNASGLNGKGTLTTSGTQWTQASAFASSSSATIFLVWKIANAAGTPFIFQRGGVNDVHSFLMNPGTNQLQARRGASNQGTLTVSGLGTADIWRVGTLVFSTTLSRVYNGNTVGTDNTATVSAPVGNKVLTLFALDSATRAGHPGIAEFLYYSSQLDDTQQAAVRTYLGNKWGITL